MFASLVFERDPFTLADLPAGIMYWTQVVGALALLGIFLWMLLGLPFMHRADRARIPPWQSKLFIACILLAIGCYCAFGIFYKVTVGKMVPGATELPTSAKWSNAFLTMGSAFALLAACLPILRNLLDLRPRRIWALARLSFQEAVRKKVLYAFALLLVFFLFANWFISSKPEDQLRSYVTSVFKVMTIFLLFIAVVIAGFSIPADISQQTIHTIITKPVERFEILLGRFLGFVGLMTVVLFIMTTLSLIYVVRGVDPDAAAESLKAREAVYGDLTFEGTEKENRGISVGKEWDYRSYVAAEMPGQPAQYAIWSFPTVPPKLAERTTVPCEFTFDIYRTTKGDENVGIKCQFVFTSWRFKKGSEDEYRSKRNKERSKTVDRLSDAEIDNKLADEFGYFEIPTVNVTDYHTMTVSIPGGLFKNAAQSDPDPTLKTELTRRNQSTAPVQVRVKCTSPTQYLGMAKHDLYLRGDDPNSGKDRLWFAWNFYKAGFGLWLRLCMVIGLAVVLSTYLSGVISLLATILLYGLGLSVEFVQTVGSGKNVGGGPMEASLRMIRRENLVTPLEETTTNTIAKFSDDYFRVFVRAMLNVLPDVNSSNLVQYVAEGFNIGPERIVVAMILMIGYILPWFLLGYYLLKWREIASSS